MRARRDTAPLGSGGLTRDAIRAYYLMQRKCPDALDDFEADEPTTSTRVVDDPDARISFQRKAV